VSERHIDPEGKRRLKDAGFVSEEFPTGKRLWRDPETAWIRPEEALWIGWSAPRKRRVDVQT